MSNVVARKRRSSERRRICSGAGGESLTRQSFAAECDINNILTKFTRTGRLPVKAGEPFYGDFSAADDYHNSLNRVMAAEDSFMQLPSKIRNRFKNDPYEFLAFVGDESNRDEAIALGLIEDRKVVGQDEPEVNKDGDNESEQPST